MHNRISARAAAVAVLACALAACGDGGASQPGAGEAPPAFPRATKHQAGVTFSGGLVTKTTDERCVECHEDVVDAFATSGMHESLTLPTGEGSIEARLVGTEVVDADTGITGRFELHEGAYVQRMLYRDPEGVERATYSARVDLVIGSGHATRSYLQVLDGYMFELPLTWYADADALLLSPGPGFKVRVTRHATHDCIACHTGSVEPADRRGVVGFRGEISLGVGCSRCHGPADDHCDTGDPRDVANPARMDADRQADVCAQCHLTGAVAVVKHGASLAEYEPGSPLRAVYGVFDPVGGSADRGTSIAGHGSRMKLSRCFQESGDMTCTTCHNPHRGHKSEATSADTASGCLVCHDRDACHADPAARGGKTCAQCHMANLPSNDIAHTTTTDHLIRRRPPVGARSSGAHEERSVGACAVRNAELTNVLDPTDALPGSRTLKVHAYVKGIDMAADVLGRDAPGYIVRARELVDDLLEERPDDAELFLLRAHILYHQRSERAAANQLDPLIRRFPRWTEAVKLRAIVEARTAPGGAAESWLRRALDLAPYDETLNTHLAKVLEADGRAAEALTVMDDLRDAIGPTYARASFSAAIAWRAGLYERGARHTYDRLMFRPRDAAALADAADMCRAAGLPERQCRTLFDEALRVDAQSIIALVGLARLELREGRRGAARELLTRARSAAPNAAEVLELARELAAGPR